MSIFTRIRARARDVVTLAATLAVAVALTGCSAAEPDNVTWTLEAKGPIIAIDSSTGVYVSGRISAFGGGNIESRSVIDYQYARTLKTGGIREEMISTLWARYDYGTESDYPGSNIVTIYEDAKPDGTGARIEVWECATGGLGLQRCAMPDGADMGTSRVRIDIHVPPGTVVQPFDDQSAPTAPATASTSQEG